MAGDLLTRLQQLHALILRERECARTLAMEELQAVAAAKEELLPALEGAAGSDPEVRALAAKIREENRRNAYLLWSALQWVREMMTFFGQRAVPAGYGAGGGMVAALPSGRLLSGRV